MLRPASGPARLNTRQATQGAHLPAKSTPRLIPGKPYLLSGPPESFTALLLQLIHAGGVQLLLLGNRFDIYHTATQLAAAAGGDYYALLEERVRMARAETAQQAVTLLNGAGQPRLPVLVRDLLAPFGEEGLPPAESSQLLGRSLARLEAIAKKRVVVIHLRPAARQQPGFEQVARICIPAPHPGDQPMGHTKDTFTNRFEHELRHFTAMRRALLLSRDRRLFGRMLDKAAFHIPASEQAAHPLPVISILLSIDLEQEKALDSLENRLGQSEQQLQALQTENLSLHALLDELQEDLDQRMQALREDLLHLRFPDYVD